MIRLKNIDFKHNGMKRNQNVYLGDVTASRETVVFVAPLDCVVDRVELYNNENQAVTTSPVVSLYLGTATASTLGANHTATLSAGARLQWGTSQCSTIMITSNNSLTEGDRLAMSFNISGSSNWSAAIVAVMYTPKKHRKDF